MKIALIDDHALVLQGLQAKLETIADFEIVGAYTEVNDLLLCLKYKDVDIVVMDLMLKGIHGFELIEKIKHLRDKEIKIKITNGIIDENLINIFPLDIIEEVSSHIVTISSVGEEILEK